MKRIVASVLNWLAHRVMLRYRPQVIAVTGSYGKTSTKEAIAAVLAEAYAVRSAAKSFNNQFGVPFTVLGVSEQGSGIARFVSALWNGITLLMKHRVYPTVMVLEMGADQPGDITRLIKLAPLTIGVITSIGPTHLQRFGTVEAVFAEKSQLATQLGEHGWAVLNGDDPRARQLGEISPCRIVSYGFQSGVAVRCVDAAVAQSDASGAWGMALSIEMSTERFPVFLEGVTGRHSAYAALAAIAVGVAYKLDVVEIAAGLRNYKPPHGRMRVLSGVKKTILIDDTYNASPDACAAALEALREFPAERERIAILGEMAELGSATEAAHRTIGTTVVDEHIDVLIAVGEKMRSGADEATSLGMDSDRVFTFPDALSAARFVQDRLKPGDVVLVKGSQVARMEKATKELMAEPERAGELLVRQDRKWLRT